MELIFEPNLTEDFEFRIPGMVKIGLSNFFVNSNYWSKSRFLAWEFKLFDDFTNAIHKKNRQKLKKYLKLKICQNWFLDQKSARCFKITEKVSCNNASEASYIYILSGQKFIKIVKNFVHGTDQWEGFPIKARRLKITDKVSINIASKVNSV